MVDERLPLDLFKTYLRSKKSTRTILDWLLANGAEDYDCPFSLSVLTVKDIYSLARVVQRRSVRLPGRVAHAFRLTVNARRQISHFFKQSAGSKSPQIATHEYFTTT